MAEWTEAEEHVLRHLRKLGFQHIQRPDWIARDKQGRWWSFEVKAKERFEPPPFAGHGLNASQLHSRLALQVEKGIRAVLVVLDPEIGWIMAPLDQLSNGPLHKTRNGVIIFPIDRFRKVEGLMEREFIDAAQTGGVLV